MIEIDIETADAAIKGKVRQFEEAAAILSDVLTDELVREARRQVPSGTRMRIGREKIGQRWRVFARDSSAQPSIEAALQEFDWPRVLRLLLNKMK